MNDGEGKEAGAGQLVDAVGVVEDGDAGVVVVLGVPDCSMRYYIYIYIYI